MSNLENANSPISVSPSALRTWDFMETMFVGLIAYGVYTLTSGIVLAMLAAPDAAKILAPDQFQSLGIAYIVSSPLAIAVLWIAIRMARRDFVEYLALKWPSAGQLLRALAITAILLFAQSLAVYFIDAGELPPSPYLNIRQAGGLLIFLIGGCIAAPIMEEFVLRGFIFRGWSQSFLGPVGSIVLTSALWGMMHTQYNWLGRFCVFLAGLVLGHFRWRSNSTWLTVVVHSAINVFLFFTIGP
jgi:uncharacterized protein